MLQLREYQIRGIADIRRSYENHKRAPLYVLPTGGGKSLLFTWMVGRAVRGGRSVCIIVHRDHLIWQLAETLTDQGIPFGIISPGFDPLHRPVQIASIHTLVRRLDVWPRFDWLVVDEAHHAAASTWMKILRHYEKTMVLGVTATPARLDGKGLGRVFDDMIFGPTMRELIEQGYLANYRLFSPTMPTDLAELHSRAGDYKIEEAAAAMDKAAITGDAVAHYAKHLAGAPAIAVCVTVEHAHHVSAAFREAGFSSRVIEASTDRNDRDRMLRDLAAGRLNVLSSCEVVSEGTDVPVCQGALLLRPTKSLTLYLQACGRALRPKADRSPAIILDHAGNSALHGVPAMDRQWTLDDGAVKAKSKALVKECKFCFAINDASATECAVCGESFRRPGEGVGMPQVVAGELIERAGIVVPEGVNVLTMPLKDLTAKAETLEQLEAIGQARGYKAGWAKHFHDARNAAFREHSKGGDGRPHSNRRWTATRPW